MIPDPPSHKIVRDHLTAYEQEGREIDAELEDIAFQRRRITTNRVVRLVFGTVGNSGVFAPEWSEDREYPNRLRPIVLTQPGATYPAFLPDSRSREDVARQLQHASELAYPGLRTCLLTWLDQREIHARKALAAWEARDAVAEAVALVARGAGDSP